MRKLLIKINNFFLIFLLYNNVHIELVNNGIFHGDGHTANIIFMNNNMVFIDWGVGIYDLNKNIMNMGSVEYLENDIGKILDDNIEYEIDKDNEFRNIAINRLNELRNLLQKN